MTKFKKVVTNDFDKYEELVKERLEEMKMENPEQFKIVLDVHYDGENLEDIKSRDQLVKDAYYYGDCYSKSEDLMSSLIKETLVEIDEDVLEDYDYDDFRSELISEFLEVDINSQELEKEYEKFKLQWLIDHGFSLKDIIREMDKNATEHYETLEEHCSCEEAFEEFEENGFCGMIYPCYNEWLENDYQEDDFCDDECDCYEE